MAAKKLSPDKRPSQRSRHLGAAPFRFLKKVAGLDLTGPGALRSPQHQPVPAIVSQIAGFRFNPAHPKAFATTSSTRSAHLIRPTPSRRILLEAHTRAVHSHHTI